MKKFSTLLVVAFMTILGMNAQDALIYITGDGTEIGWTTNCTEKNQLKWNEDTQTYDWTGNFISGNRFRFITTNKWYPTYTTTESSHTVITEDGTFPIQYDETGRSGEPSFKMGVSGNFTVSVSLADMTMSIKGNDEKFVNLYITGGCTKAGWKNNRTELGNDTNRQMFTRLSDTQYTWTGILQANKGDGRFRFLTSESESNSWWQYTYTTTEENSAYEITTGEYPLRYWDSPNGPQPEAAFKITKSGLYTINIDTEALTMTINHAEIGLMGAATESGWDTGKWNNILMTLEEDGTYTWTGNLFASDFRLFYRADWWPCITTDSNEDETITDGSHGITQSWNGKSLVAPEEGNYTLVLNFDDLTLNVTYNGSAVETPEEPLTELWLCGNAMCGKDGGWDTTDEYIKPMEATENPGEFTWTGDLHNVGENGGQFKFRLAGPDSGSWDGFVAYPNDVTLTSDETQSYPIVSTTGNQDKKFFVKEDGKYKIVANTYGKEKSVTITKESTVDLNAVNATDAAVKVIGRQVIAENATVCNVLGQVIAVVNGSATLPAAGIYVVVANGNATKIAVK